MSKLTVRLIYKNLIFNSNLLFGRGGEIKIGKKFKYRLDF